MSTVLPAPAGTTARSGFVGQVCATAPVTDRKMQSVGNIIKQVGFTTFSGYTSRLREAGEIRGAILAHGLLSVQYIISITI